MKLVLYLFVVFISVSMIFSNCGKYEEGPGLSLRSKSERISNKWIIEKEFENGEEKELTPLDQFYFFEIKKDGSGKEGNDEYSYMVSGAQITIPANSIKFEWEFDDKKDAFRVRYNGDSDWEEWKNILRLSEKELWIKFTDEAGDEYEIHYKPI